MTLLNLRLADDAYYPKLPVSMHDPKLADDALVTNWLVDRGQDSNMS